MPTKPVITRASRVNDRGIALSWTIAGAIPGDWDGLVLTAFIEGRFLRNEVVDKTTTSAVMNVSPPEPASSPLKLKVKITPRRLGELLTDCASDEFPVS